MAVASLTAGPGISVSRKQKADDSAEIVARLVAGDKAAWDAFVERYSPVIYGAAHKAMARAEHASADATDVAQDVFLRLCKQDFRLLRRYEPERAALSTWLTVVTTSTTLDFLRRKRGYSVPLDDMPAELNAVDPVEPPEKIRIPEGLLSPRQALVLKLVFERDMDVAEAAAVMGIDRQTVRSTQHKALVKLRRHFGTRE